MFLWTVLLIVLMSGGMPQGKGSHQIAVKEDVHLLLQNSIW